MRNILYFFISSFILSGCAQDDLVEKQQAAANDLSGQYESIENGAKSTLKMIFDIKNEQPNFDINVVVRRDKLSPQEIAFYNSIGIAADFAEGLIKISAFGVGIQSWAEIPQSLSGDSISIDKGKSTRIFVCSKLSNWRDKFWIRYCLSGISKKNSKIITGKLHTYVSSTLRSGESFIFYRSMDQLFMGNLKDTEELVVLE